MYFVCVTVFSSVQKLMYSES